jgi:hypothetical protein
MAGFPDNNCGVLAQNAGTVIVYVGGPSVTASSATGRVPAAAGCECAYAGGEHNHDLCAVDGVFHGECFDRDAVVRGWGVGTWEGVMFNLPRAIAPGDRVSSYECVARYGLAPVGTVEGVRADVLVDVATVAWDRGGRTCKYCDELVQVDS